MPRLTPFQPAGLQKGLHHSERGPRLVSCNQRGAVYSERAAQMSRSVSTDEGGPRP